MMALRGLLLFIALSFSLAGFSAEAITGEFNDDPEKFCDENPNCSEQMREIIGEYAQGATKFLLLPQSAFSGECYHLNPDYHPDHAHHGAFSFDQFESKVMVNGIFSFFSEEDPYRSMTAQELMAFLNNQSPSSEGTVKPAHLQLDYVFPGVQIHYWFRSNEASEYLNVIGFQFEGRSQSMLFCRMNRH